jgi:hypothetical protein
LVLHFVYLDKRYPPSECAPARFTGTDHRAEGAPQQSHADSERLGAPDILGQLWSLPSVEYVPATASPFLAQSKVPARIRFAAWPIAGVVGLLHVYVFVRC